MFPAIIKNLRVLSLILARAGESRGGGLHAAVQVGAYQCTCVPSFEGINCDVSSVCDVSAAHVVSRGPTSCTCTVGWEGRSCARDVDECKSQPCYNNAQCVQPRQGIYACSCSPGFAGAHCSRDV